MRSRTIHTSPDDNSFPKKVVYGYTWHTSTTDQTAEDSSCSSFYSFGLDQDETKTTAPPKKVVFNEHFNQVKEVESWREYSDLWWDDEELMEIKGNCNVIVREYRKKHDLIDSIANILAQGMTNTHDPLLVKRLLAEMKKCDEARGLERDAAAPCAKLEMLHYKSIFETQKKLRSAKMMGTNNAWESLAKSCEKSSKAFALLASRFAQHDTREAMRAAFSFGNVNAMTKGKENRMQRRASVGGRTSKITMTRVDRRASLSASTYPSEGPRVDGRAAMAKRAGGFDRRKMLANSVSMRSVNSKYGSLGF